MKHGQRLLMAAPVVVVLAVVLVLLAAGGQGALADGVIIYVDADSTGEALDGSSWEEAFLDVHEALAVAESGDEIWVAAGTYRPRDEVGGSGDRYKTFQLMNGVAIYGGFDPETGDTEWSDRDWVNNATILSGDVGIMGDPSDNCYHVFFHPVGTNLDSTAILDGFTVTGGNADGTDRPVKDGGGMYNEESSPRLSNTIFLSNHARAEGGGMHNYRESSPVLTNVAFSGNSATNGGGGMFNAFSSSPTLTGCTFEGNSTYGYGGGMWNWERSSPTLNDVTFANNSAYFHGGGVYNQEFSSPELTNCSFEGNSVDGDGGGMANYSDSSPTLTHCTFDGNSAGTQGGGISNHVLWLEMIDCSFSGNSAEDGGGMYNTGHPTLSNCTFSGNSATNSGGGMYNGWKSWAVLADCTFLGNSAQVGGGMANSGASPTLTDCTFSGNSASRGGGMHNDGEYSYMISHPTLSHVTFEGNWASMTGGGMHNGNNSLAKLTDCSFEGNSAAESGGGMYNEVSGAELSGCTFISNSAQAGAGMYNVGSWPTLDGCTFAGNSADSGGGMYNHSFSSPTLNNCTFEGNLADLRGGGMLNYSSSPMLTGCIFSNNDSASAGGGMSNVESSAPLLINCTFEGNSAKGGGGMHNDGFSSPELTNCTFWGNDAGSGGGMLDEWSSPVLANSILWGNSPDQIYDDANSSPVVSYSDVQDGYPGAGNMDADPLFIDPSAGDFHLGPASPCIDAGNNAAPDLPARDFEGDPRILDGDGDGTAVVDMGVDEVWGPPPPVIYVDQDAAATNSGTSWADAFIDLQDAFNWAIEGVEIWVAEGTYKPTVEHGGTGDRFKSFQMVNGVAIYGGFDPSVGDDTWGERDWANNVTILSGDLNGDDGPDFANNDENSYHVLFHPWEMTLDSSAVLDGFTITGGNANRAPDDDLNNRGGGMGNFGTSPAVANCIFRGNSASHAGGGMFNSVASPVVANSNFSGNRAGNVGGGMSNWASSPIVTGCTFEGNSAGLYGGGMRNAEGSAPVLIDCAFEGNSATQRGGGMFSMWASTPVLVNCTFWGNSSDNGGGMYNLDSSPVLTNCTFWGNSATSGGGMFNDATSAPVLTNCILWGDAPDEVAGGSPVVTYSDVQGGYLGAGNIDQVPLFQDPANGDFHLGPGSPCIDVGNNAAPDLPDLDFEGDGRVLDGDGNVLAIVDMGVDEVAITWPYFRAYLPLVIGGY
jgi:predicted outer membrane repeat protein